MSTLNPGRVEVFVLPPKTHGPKQVELRFTGWKSVRITRRLDAIAGEFALEISPERAPRLDIGSRVAIALEGTEVLRGHIESLQVVEGEGPAQITYSGRDLAGDLVDCTPDGLDTETEWRNLWLDELLEKIVGDRADLVLDQQVLRKLGPMIPLFRLNQGETYHRAIERACRMRGAMAYSLSTGEIAIAPPFGARVQAAIRPKANPGPELFGRVGEAHLVLVAEAQAAAWSDLVWGRNIKSYRLERNGADRFRTYIVKGQAVGGLDVELGVGVLHAEGISVDRNSREDRTLVIVAETNAWGDDLQGRAEWEAAWRASQASKLTVEAVGWRPAPGRPLWAINQLVRAVIPHRNLNDLLAPLEKFPSPDMLVNALTFRMSAEGGGTTTALELARRDSYARQAEIPEVPDAPEDEGVL